MKPETVLLTDGEQRSTLALARSLGRAGHRVHVCSSRTRSLAGSSRHCSGESRVPDALREPPAFVAAVRELVSRWSVTALVPVTEASLLALLPERESFPGTLLPFADEGEFSSISDKERVLAAAAGVGIAAPLQCVLRSSADRGALETAGVRFPVVVKPARSVSGSSGARVKLDVRHAADRAELDRCLDALPDAAYPLLVQQRVVGPGVGVFLLLWEGELRALFAHRRLREKPPAGGVSVYRESVAADPELVSRTVELLRRFRWRGVAMVEYKVESATGVPYLMEINGRFWGSLQLAVDAGVDFPVLLLDAARGRRCEAVTSYREGVRSRWWWGDVDHLITRLRRSPEQLALPDDAPSRAAAVREFFTLWRPGDRNEILRIADPAPFLRETLDWVARR